MFRTSFVWKKIHPCGGIHVYISEHLLTLAYNSVGLSVSVTNLFSARKLRHKNAIGGAT